MTQVWKGDSVVPVTKINAGPCTILQRKTNDKDGYEAVQLGYGKRRLSLLTKPLLGHFKNLGNFRYVREIRLNQETVDAKVGDQVSVATFTPGDRLTIVGISKGKGFQGVVKRHGFHGQDASHGNKDQLRASGSVGAGGVQHVFKGTRMGGRMGGDQVTLHDVEVVEVDEMNNSIFVKGSLPGARHSLVMLFGEGELKLGLPVTPVVEEVKVEETIRTTDITDEKINTDEATEDPVVEEPKIEEVKTEEVKEEVKVEPASAEAPAGEEAK